MKNTEIVVGKLIRRETMPSSKNGNPRYKLTVGEPGDSVTVWTQPDAMIAYGPAVNPKIGATLRITYGEHYGKLQIESIKEL